MLHRSLWIAVIQLTSLFALADKSEQPSLKVYVYNQANVPGRVLGSAEQAAGRIFRVSGLSTIWINCSTRVAPGINCTGLPQSRDVIIQFIHEPRRMEDDVFGAAFVGKNGTGQYADIYYDRVGELHRDSNVSLGDVVAHMMAHEIGHLLGLNSHSVSGIMRGSWCADELHAAERGRLLFSSDQSGLMRERLLVDPAERNRTTTSDVKATPSGN
jgi:hypothetical protein